MAISPVLIDPRVQQFADRIRRQFNPERIILFGSYARGEQTFDSDVDLLVVIDAKGSLRKLSVEIGVALSDREIPLDLVVVTPKQYERGKNQIGNIVQPAVSEGRVLYERAA